MTRNPNQKPELFLTDLMPVRHIPYQFIDYSHLEMLPQ